MATTYVLFDKKSGRILDVHHGAKDAEEVRRDAQRHAPDDAKVSDEHAEVIALPPDAAKPEKLYKVDVTRKTLMETEGEDGVGFGFGSAAGNTRTTVT